MDARTAIAIPAAIAVLVGGLVSVDRYVAKATDLRQVSMRLDQKIRSDKIYNLQQQIWQMEDRYRGVPEYEWEPHDLDRYRRLELELQSLMRGT